jgi:hypothetical protein
MASAKMLKSRPRRAQKFSWPICLERRSATTAIGNATMGMKYDKIADAIPRALLVSMTMAIEFGEYVGLRDISRPIIECKLRSRYTKAFSTSSADTLPLMKGPRVGYG